MKHLCFPASYARLSEEEQCETIGGGDLPGRGNDLQQAERPVRLSGRDPDGFPAVYRRDAQ